MQDFTRLVVWQRSDRLSIAIYRATKCFPPEERFGLRRQIRSAATSIEFNIAEGCGRRTQREFANSLGIASGSSSELQCELLLAHDLGWLPPDQLQQLIGEVVQIRCMLVSLIRRVLSARERQVRPPSRRAVARSTESKAPRSGGDATESNGVAASRRT